MFTAISSLTEQLKWMYQAQTKPGGGSQSAGKGAENLPRFEFEIPFDFDEQFRNLMRMARQGPE